MCAASLRSTDVTLKGEEGGRGDLHVQIPAEEFFFKSWSHFSSPNDVDFECEPQFVISPK